MAMGGLGVKPICSIIYSGYYSLGNFALDEEETYYQPGVK